MTEPLRGIDPTRAQFKELFVRAPASGPLQMLNLLAFQGTTEDGRTGRKAYADYSKAVPPLLASVGGSVL